MTCPIYEYILLVSVVKPNYFFIHLFKKLAKMHKVFQVT